MAAWAWRKARRRAGRSPRASGALTAARAFASWDLKTASRRFDGALRRRGGERQRAERRVDGAAQRVVDAHLLQRIGGDVGRSRAGLGVEKVAGLRPVNDKARWRGRSADDCRRAPRGSPRPAAAPRRRVRRSPFRSAGNLSSRNCASVSSSASARATAQRRRRQQASSVRTRAAQEAILRLAMHGGSRSAHGAWRRKPISPAYGGRILRLKAERISACQPPHLPVLTLKLPQESGLRQSAIRSREPSR